MQGSRLSLGLQCKGEGEGSEGLQWIFGLTLCFHGAECMRGVLGVCMVHITCSSSP